MKKYLPIAALLVLLSAVLSSSAQIITTPVGTSGNVLSVIDPGPTMLDANSSLNSVMFIHRSNPNSFGGGGSQYRIDVSTNSGGLWTSDLGPINSNATLDNTNFARFPQGIIFNPSGNSIADSAYVIYSGTYHDNVKWTGQVRGRGKITGNPATFNTSLDPINSGQTSIGKSLCQGAANTFWSVNVHDAADFTNTTSLVTGISVQKGVFNTTTKNVTWTSTTIPVTFATTAQGGSACASWQIAFDPSGQNGWISILGDLTNDADSVYTPIFWRTTNGGTNWTGPIVVDLETVPGVKMILDSFNLVDGAFTGLNPTTAFDADLAVDINGNPHLLVAIGCGAEHSIINAAMDMWDITYSANGNCNWRGNYLDRLYTLRGIYSTDGQTDDNRPQICRTPDGTRLFFFYTKSDIEYWQSLDNNHPNLYCVGINVSTGTRTPTYSMSEGDPVWGAETASSLAGSYGGAAFTVISPNALVAANTYYIPTIFTRIDDNSGLSLGLGDGAQPASYHYTNSFNFIDAQFSYFADLIGPDITLNGSNPMTITAGSAYNEPGATATDCVDGTVNVGISGTVNTNVVGTYNVTYTAMDAAGNTDTVIRVVNVISAGGSAPTVVTVAATGVTTTGATLNGTVTANTLSTAVTFQYGLTTNYGSTVAGIPSPVTGTTATNVSATIGSLTPNTTYHYRAVGASTGGTTNGIDRTFTTLAQSGGPCTPNPNTTSGMEPKSANVGCITQGTSFSQVYTFVVPASADPGIGTPVPINNMTIDSIVNLPAGLTWTPGVTPPIYAGGTSGCFTVSGTTNAPCGQYTMLIYVTVNTGFGPFSGELTALTQQFAIPGFDQEYLRVIASGGNCPAVNTSPSGNFVANPNCASSSISVTITQTNVSCFGGANGTATANPTGGSNYTYIWSNGQQSQTATGLAAGNYRVTVTSNGSQTATATFDITQPTAIAITTSSTPTACSGSTGTVSANVSGGTPTYTQVWSSGSTTNLAAGTYTVTVTDSRSCTATATATVTASSGNLSVSANPTAVNCFGASTGSVTAVVSGNNGVVTYNWNPGTGNGAAVFNLAAGVVRVTATDASGCSASASATITQPSSAVTASATSTGTSCSGSTGTASATGNGGTAPYTYSWNNGGSGITINNLAGGNYTVTITDNKGCTATATTTVATPANFTVSVSSTAVTCYGQSTGSVTATVSGGTGNISYLWNTSANTATLSNQPAGTYNVTVTDGSGCSKSANGTITQPANPLAVSISTSASACGASSGSATATVTGNSGNPTYSWSNGGNSATINGLAAAIYNLTVTAGGCSVTGTAAVNNSNGPTLNVLQNNPTCFGSANGSATAVANGGQTPYSYVWNTTATGASISNLIAGTYTVIVTDNSGCAATSVVTLIQPDAITFNATTTNVNCFGAQTGAATLIVGGGTGPYQYSWSSGGSNPTISNLASGPYTLTVTDSRSCTAVNTVNITQPAQALAVNITSTPTTGNDGTATAAVTGGTNPYQYSWSNSQTTATATGLAQGTVNVTVTDSKGCTVTGSHIILTTGIEETIANTSVVVYPNPASDVLTVDIELSNTHKVGFRIADATGKMVYVNTQTVTGNVTQRLNTSELAAGVYMMEITIDNYTTHRRFVIGR